jgi:hypothetical protein
MSTTTKNSETINIGILAVHGMGEQSQFEHLKEVANQIAKALQEDRTFGKLDVRIVVNTSPSGAFKSKEQTWDAATGAPVVIEAQSKLFKKQICFNFHEVWWADLGEPNTLQTAVEFWLWGLGLWLERGYLKNPISDNYPTLLLPFTGKARISFGTRLEYFGIALLFVLVLPLLSLINIILGRLIKRRLRLNIISQYLGKVKLYQQKQRIVDGFLMDFDQPPRATVRRRMVKALVNMAMQDYDRWYVLAHSQGSVVAFNGLSEPEQILPNYIDKSLWDNKFFQHFKKKAHENEKAPVQDMMPTRPMWLKDDDLIDRKELFKKLRGFVTYGCPLGHFADLWPGIVPANTQPVFPDNCQWINIFDPSDPVASQVKGVFPDNCPNACYIGPPRLVDIAYKAEGLHLISHTQYLTYNPSKQNSLVRHLVSWMLGDDREFSPPEKPTPEPEKPTPEWRKTPVWKWFSLLCLSLTYGIQVSVIELVNFLSWVVRVLSFGSVQIYLNQRSPWLNDAGIWFYKFLRYTTWSVVTFLCAVLLKETLSLSLVQDVFIQIAGSVSKCLHWFRPGASTFLVQIGAWAFHVYKEILAATLYKLPLLPWFWERGGNLIALAGLVALLVGVWRRVLQKDDLREELFDYLKRHPNKWYGLVNSKDAHTPNLVNLRKKFEFYPYKDIEKSLEELVKQERIHKQDRNHKKFIEYRYPYFTICLNEETGAFLDQIKNLAPELQSLIISTIETKLACVPDKPSNGRSKSQSLNCWVLKVEGHKVYYELRGIDRGEGNPQVLILDLQKVDNR